MHPIINSGGAFQTTAGAEYLPGLNIPLGSMARLSGT